ncbi:glycosyltransferase family 4 protein [Vibrio splendidus]|uniref:glycosyltransferase family 4 protein n=1 Tax=Vibrio splendidus TaxID=29497 RepID=UPI000C819347|nr:glycosyltransferase family 1 protein [Vibrio splendidus]PMI50808.1 hypothetical protein BCU42_09075 [Vibrio splendidus]
MKVALCCSSELIDSIAPDLILSMRKYLQPCRSKPWLFVLDDVRDDWLSELLGRNEYRCYSSVFEIGSHQISSELVKSVISNYGYDEFVCLNNDPITPILLENIDKSSPCSESESVSFEVNEKKSIDEFIGVVKDYGVEKVDLGKLSRVLAEIYISDGNFLYVDISTLIHFDHATGIQRVVKEISNKLLSFELPVGCHLVYSYPDHNHFYYAKSSGEDYVTSEVEAIEDFIVDFSDGDKLLFLDLHPSNAYTKNEVIQGLQKRGIESYFVVYDLLPVSHPQYFVQELVDDFHHWLETVALSNGAFCISNDVKEKLSQWIEDTGVYMYPQFKCEYFHLGADFDTSAKKNNDKPKQAPEVESQIVDESINVFLMVGTVEPRKGHKDVLDSFDELWASGKSDTLIIVGKAGWRNDELIKRLKTHPMLGKSLFWLQGLSDGYLDYLYRNSTCLIAASEGEGFGLPLIEAAQYGLPIIARDIQIFREVGGDFVEYFSKNGDDLLINRLMDFDSSTRPDSSNIKYLTWDESVGELARLVLD